MAVAEIRPDWTVGTLTLVGGSKDFTTTGSALETAAIQAGDEIITASGNVLIIADITGQNSGTLMEVCPVAAAGADQPLRIRFQPDGSRYNGATADLIQRLSSGNLYAFSELQGVADGVPVFTGSGTMDVVPKSEFGPTDTHGNLAALAGLSKENNQFIVMGATGDIGKKPISDITDAIAENASDIQDNKIAIQNNSNAIDSLSSSIRLKISSNTTINVSPVGDDATGSVSSPFKTISAALKFIYTKLDLNSFSVTVKISDGSYNENLSFRGRCVGSGSSTSNADISIVGNLSSPANVKLGLSTGIQFHATNGAVVSLSGVQFNQGDYSINASGSGTNVYLTGAIQFNKQEYDHIASSSYSAIFIQSDYTILGGAMNHLHATEGGAIHYSGTRSISVQNNPNFWGQFVGCAFSTILAIGVTYVGSATGRRFLCHYNGEIRTETNNRDLFPGSISGAMLTGGRYDSVPFAAVSLTNDASLSANTPTLVPWNATEANISAMLIADYKFVPSTGFCSIEGRVSFQGLNAGQHIYVILYKNGSMYRTIEKVVAGQYDGISFAFPNIQVNDADYFQIYTQYSANGGSIRGISSFTYVNVRQI